MIVLESFAALSALMASAAPVAEIKAPAPVRNSVKRCALHQLPMPPGKGLIMTVQRCSDTSAESQLSKRERTPVEATTPATHPTA